MITKIERRLVKEAFIALARKHPKAIEMRSYVMCLGSSASSSYARDSFGSSTLSVVRSGVVPLPVNNGTIFVLSSNGADDPDSCCAAYWIQGNRIHQFWAFIDQGVIVARDLSWFEILPGHAWPKTLEFKGDSRAVTRAERIIVEEMALAGFPVSSEIVRTMSRASCLLYVWFVSGLAMATVPCGYIVRSRFGDGFGHPSMRKKTAQKDFFVHIHYDRLYREMGERLGATEVNPHFRRGHTRYWWKSAGIDRLTLPLVPHKRLEIAIRNDVPTSYIHPHWVGRKTWHDGDCDFEILGGETELP